MTELSLTLFQKGCQRFLEETEELQKLYPKLLDYSENKKTIVFVKDKELFHDAIRLLGPKQSFTKSQLSLEEIYDVAIHPSTGAIIVASKSANLFSKSPVYGTNYIVRYRTAAVYMPGLGVELANIGIVGDIQQHKFVLRSESACTPSFLFNTQTCNCAYQWRCTHELAAAFNRYDETEKHNSEIFNSDSTPVSQHGVGFLLIHLETQNGMGIGYTEGDFSLDLATRAHLRHVPALTVNQDENQSMNDIFEAMELPLDPRRASNAAGYSITPILMDFLQVNKTPVLLSNNPQKIAALKKFGYHPERLKALGEINEAGKKEALMRNRDLGHMDIGAENSSFEQEFERLKAQIALTMGVPTEVSALAETKTSVTQLGEN